MLVNFTSVDDVTKTMHLDDTPDCHVNLIFSETTSFRANILCVALFNIVVLIPTVILNSLVVLAFIRKSSLRKTGNILLIGLSVTDLLSGLIAQPVFVAILLVVLTDSWKNIPCSLELSLSLIGYSLACISLVSVSFISSERYLAIFHPFTYQKLVTTKRLYMTIVFIWVMSIALVLSLVLLKFNDVFFWVNTIVISFSYILNIYVYISISRKVTSLRRAFTKIRSRFDVSRLSSDSQSKSTKVCGSIIVALLLCYLPQIVVSLWRLLSNDNLVYEYFEYWAITFGLLNPALNPIFYCCYNSVIRREMVYLLRCGKGIVSPSVVSFQSKAISEDNRSRQNAAFENYK